MKTFLLTTCIFGALVMASAAPSRAGDLSHVEQHELRLADDCETLFSEAPREKLAQRTTSQKIFKASKCMRSCLTAIP